MEPLESLSWEWEAFRTSIFINGRRLNPCFVNGNLENLIVVDENPSKPRFFVDGSPLNPRFVNGSSSKPQFLSMGTL